MGLEFLSELISHSSCLLPDTKFVGSTYRYPNIPGMEEYSGKIMHSAAWDGSYDLTNKTVAVIGGGSSAVQIIPKIQPGESLIYARI